MKRFVCLVNVRRESEGSLREAGDGKMPIGSKDARFSATDWGAEDLTTTSARLRSWQRTRANW